MIAKPCQDCLYKLTLRLGSENYAKIILMKFSKKQNKFSLLILILCAILIYLFLKEFSERKILFKKAEETPLEITFTTTAAEPLLPIWKNFAQGGEKSAAMLTPAAKEIKALEPGYIRIDHLFDFYDIVRRGADGKLIYNFVVLDERVNEILDLGAKPFLALSYFPRAISKNLTEIPPSFSEWEDLIFRVIQRYSGREEKNIPDVYYEVWNEPDLFGEMGPEVYFSLYNSSVKAAEKCQNCQPFKIGGPAISTLKNFWMETFLSLVRQQKVRMDFVSWHSYQKNPEKTLWEINTLKNLASFTQMTPKPEVIISEWGSTPEISSWHDSFFDASHTIATIVLLQNSVDKIFAFEIKDGLSPTQAQYWGRWGLLTNEKTGLTAKPRYYSFIFLNKLFNYQIQKVSGNLPGIGTTDKQGNFKILLTRNDQSFGQKNIKVKVLRPSSGSYGARMYFLDQVHDPLTPYPLDIYFEGGSLTLSFTSLPLGTYLIEILKI